MNASSGWRGKVRMVGPGIYFFFAFFAARASLRAQILSRYGATAGVVHDVLP